MCKSDSDCIDFDGCTKDICNSESRICENFRLNETECIACRWVSIELIPDNYPEETSWMLESKVDKRDSILSGEYSEKCSEYYDQQTNHICYR